MVVFDKLTMTDLHMICEMFTGTKVMSLSYYARSDSQYIYDIIIVNNTVPCMGVDAFYSSNYQHPSMHAYKASESCFMVDYLIIISF